MPTSDISRWSTDYRKRYDGVRLKQGAVLTDDDVNEAARLDLEEERKTRVHVIGPTGSPDSGFLIQNPNVAGGLVDFDVLQGSLYLGGLRLRLDDRTSYLAQSDFLQIDAVPAPSQDRLDLAYVEAWQQHVSPVEDDELFEVALGGPDTSTRLKTMQRVHIAAGIANEDCRQAFNAVIAGLTGSLNEELELAVDARLTVSFDPASTSGDLCSPPVQGGYLGAENQAIRVELVDGGSFTWGFDNASPLYRAEIHNNGAGQPRIVHLLTAPRDQAHWPLVGQTIEILSWAALLPNREKVTDTSGFLAKADASFNPDTQDFSIDTSLPANFGLGWQKRSDAAALAADPQFFYVRIWNRGADTSSPPGIPFSPNTDVALGDTGLQIRFAGTQFRRGDHWVIAARPEARDEVVPWQLMVSREPHGYERYFAPLAVIRWTIAGNQVSGTVIDDCRATFPPLTRLRNCCTFTVGDGVDSFGQFTSIQAAVDTLPPAGGEVCVLPGRYAGSIRIKNRSRIRIHGCGHRSLIVPADADLGPLVFIEDSQHIRIDSLRLEAGERSAIVSREVNAKLGTSGITLEKLEIEAAWIAMDLEVRQDLRILHNAIAVTGAEFRQKMPPEAIAPALIVRADDVLIEGNVIARTPAIARQSGPLGGLHLRGGCERVQVRRNHINGGHGNGITLGSFRLKSSDSARPVLVFPGAVLTFDDDGCPVIVVDPGGSSEPPPPQLVSEGFLYDILIHDNHIERMGMSGIAGAFAFALTGLDNPRFTVVTSVVFRLEITANRVESCLALDLGTFPVEFEDRLAFGGVALQLVDDLVIRENRIENNGAAHASPVCGVFGVTVLGAIIDENVIAGNGPGGTGDQQTLFGTRGGIILPDVRTIAVATSIASAAGRTAFPQPVAIHIHNNVVSAPLGPALRLGASGPVSVLGNRLLSRGFPRRIDVFEPVPASAGITGAAATSAVFSGHREYLAATPLRTRLQDVLSSSVVMIMNRGLLTGVVAAAPGFSVKESLANRPVGAGNLVPAATIGGNGGQILFDDNQVTSAESGNNAPPRFCVVLFSLDDISMQSNQSDYHSSLPFVCNSLVYASTVRVNGNRFQEPQPTTTISAITGGLMNITSLNVATHCIVALPVGAIVDTGNLPDSCRQLAQTVINLLVQLLTHP